jgi:hypothetical protein
MREYHDCRGQSSFLGCNQELTLPTLTDHGSFIMVSELLFKLFMNAVAKSLRAGRGAMTADALMNDAG